jgi:hypothetical protein
VYGSRLTICFKKCFLDLYVQLALGWLVAFGARHELDLSRFVVLNPAEETTPRVLDGLMALN